MNKKFFMSEEPLEQPIETAEPVEAPELTEAAEPAEAPELTEAAEPAEAPEPAKEAEPAKAADVAYRAPESYTDRDTKDLPYHERYYLRYGKGDHGTDLDLYGTKTFLQSIGFDGGELRQARESKDTSKIFSNADNSKGSHMHCSYCGSEIAGVEFYRLPDGRLRCTSCSSSVVKSKAEAEEICRRVLANMDSFFGATINVPISIEIVEERKLKRKIGASIGTKDDQSILILGVAINKKKKYSIILENGAPRISLIATFAHELTHIWQYINWDGQKKFKKCPKKNRLLIYEGMAKWAEIQYLYLAGETAVARREEFITRNRQDEYGMGFLLYEDRFPLSRETMVCEETPFTPGRYPF